MIRQTIVQHNVVEDQGQACGFPVRWTIDLTVERTRYFDDAGNLVRIIDHVREENTVENLATGEVLREGPDAFQQMISFEDGTVQVAINGLALNLQGEQLKDVGRVVLENQVILFSAGPHPAREAIEGGPAAQRSARRVLRRALVTAPVRYWRLRQPREHLRGRHRHRAHLAARERGQHEFV